MAGQRMRRVNEAVREVLSETLAGGLKDPRIGFVTVVSVETSPDLRSAKVYVSVLGDDEEQEKTLEGLAHCHGYLQSRLAGQLGMKHTPQLTFVRDESIEHGLRIEKLLKEIEEQ
ncbi:MAG: 30S ribosome-binding factor RbfA [Thermoleophilia bacterium]|nr:30S ribosome-binding factor RbfA [Thermoleophilia bacterium]